MKPVKLIQLMVLIIFPAINKQQTKSKNYHRRTSTQHPNLNTLKIKRKMVERSVEAFRVNRMMLMVHMSLNVRH